MTDITLHGMTVSLETEGSLHIVSTMIAYKDGGPCTHYLNAVAHNFPSALLTLAGKLQATSSVMLYLNDLGDSTHSKVHEFSLHIQDSAWNYYSAAA